MTTVLEKVTARPPRPRPRWSLWAGLAATAVITVWAAIGIEFTLAPLFTDTLRGRRIIAQFFPPNWDYIVRVWPAWVETLSIAVIASVVGCALALGAALLASKVTAPGNAVYQAAKAALSVVRSLPDIAYGLLFVAAVGTGALGGIMALVFFNLGIAAKLTAETIDAVDLGPLEAADASGGNRIQRAARAVLPQIAPNYLSYCLYVFELNIRASVVIGLVGGGGIGNVISVELARFRYDNLAALVVALFVVVFAIDQLSRAVRRRLV
ncbi:phosphonate ABC transporter, permease protein PhnE [Pseudonocardia sp.]|uniref:phosphonate ABC transporter, permease protein PhnE n=1 Tax=Pseudonocardia sp. TaxID=60912 RepID=UPI0026079AD6|nr:phosphonate ABC transporter, permease protein PhnE [Pseudonocardia sp.]